MSNHEDAKKDSFYEIEINGEVKRISRAEIEDLCHELLQGEGDLTTRLQTAFRNHPSTDIEATEETPPIGNEPEQVD